MTGLPLRGRGHGGAEVSLGGQHLAEHGSYRTVVVAGVSRGRIEDFYTGGTESCDSRQFHDRREPTSPSPQLVTRSFEHSWRGSGGASAQVDPSGSDVR